jgi:HEAT repeat protein
MMSHREPESISTAELIELALAAPAEDRDYLKARWYFVSQLHDRGDREVLDRALILTQSSLIAERDLGVYILGHLGIPERTFPDECVTALLELLTREIDPLLLKDICIALGNFTDPRSIEPLLKFRLHPDWEVRYGVVSGLSGNEDERAIAGLIELSADEYPLIRNWATFGLGTLIDVDTPSIREALYQRFLTEDSNDEETAIIYDEALMGLAHRRDERILPRLIQELTSVPVSRLAIEAAVAMADARLYPELLRLQADWYPPSEIAAALQACHPSRTSIADRS